MFGHGAADPQNLPHDVPLWIEPQQEVYFITVNCRQRGGNQLAFTKMSERIFDTVRYRQERQLWWPHVFLFLRGS